jgi:hypothetical protein
VTLPFCGVPWTGEMASAPNEGRGGDQAAAEVVDVDAAQPRRGAGQADLEEVAVGQGDDGQARLDLPHAHERAPVEALDRHAVQQAGPANLAGHLLDELLAGGGLLGRSGLDLRLHVEPDLVAR